MGPMPVVSVLQRWKGQEFWDSLDYITRQKKKKKEDRKTSEVRKRGRVCDSLCCLM